MKILPTLAIVLVTTVAAFGQAHVEENKDAKVKDEIQKLFADLNQAITQQRLCEKRRSLATVTRAGNTFSGRTQSG